MKKITITFAFFIVLAFPSLSSAIFKTPPKVRYFNIRFESKVTELMKIEFFKQDDKAGVRKDLLLKNLRELLDKGTKTI